MNIKIPVLIMLISMPMFAGLDFKNHDPLSQGLNKQDFNDIYAVYRDCFEETKRKNLVLYLMKHRGLNRKSAVAQANTLMSDWKDEAEKNFAHIRNAYLVRENGKLLGMYSCREEQPATHGAMMIFNVCVRKEKRGQGYGARIMAHAIENCPQAGEEITLTVYKEDTKVVDFYQDLDFEIIDNLDDLDDQFPYFNKYLMRYRPVHAG